MLCSGLKEVVIADGETILEFYEDVFNSCPIETLYLGRNSTEHYDDDIKTFSGRTSIKTLTIGNSVTSIGESAFKGCSGLSSLVIPNSVSSIGESAFRNCSGLKEVVIADGETILEFDEDVFDSCPIETLYLGRNFTDYELSGLKPFYGITSIKTLTIGNSVTFIGDYEFYKCTGLKSVKFPNSVTLIGDYAFYECTGLTSVEIPNSVTSIGYRAFAFCYSAPSFVSVYYNAPDPIKAGSDIFYDNYNTFYNCVTLYVPSGSVEKCKRIEPWKNFRNIKAFDFSSEIQEICEDIDESLPYEVFSLDGHKVIGDLDSLNPGIYIIRQGNTVKKIAVK